MTLNSYAKINLGLRILGKRPDGYHNIETVFRRINLCDELEISPSEEMKLTIADADLPADESNLCVRAARLLQQAYSRGDGVRIHLKKRIPIGAGLGGGSSNAAMVLRALNSMWHLNASDERLRLLAAQLGSDVPFFVSSGSAYATGRGEVLEHFNHRFPYWIVTATPALHISTSWAYGALETTPAKSPTGLKHLWQKEFRAVPEAALVNDFEPVVFRQFPEVAALKETFMELEAVAAAMSGSGSTVYGLFANSLRAGAAATSLAANNFVSITPPDFSPERA